MKAAGRFNIDANSVVLRARRSANLALIAPQRPSLARRLDAVAKEQESHARVLELSKI